MYHAFIVKKTEYGSTIVESVRQGGYKNRSPLSVLLIAILCKVGLRNMGIVRLSM